MRYEIELLQYEVTEVLLVPRVMLTTYLIFMYLLPYILESNPHSVFGDFLNGKKLVCDSDPYLSFNRPLPTGQLIE
jgi:hypothetical protein